MSRMLLRLLPVVLASAGALRCQDPVVAERFTEARVRVVVSWLAADERAGRDTGSPELEQTADWLGERFAAAGLVPLPGGSWFHEYTLPGIGLDSRAVTLKLVRKVGDKSAEFVLEPDKDVRLLRPADLVSGEEECTVGLVDDPVLQRLIDAPSARRTAVLEVPAEHPFWKRAAGAHDRLGSVRGASRPVFLIRTGVLPARSADQEVAWSAAWTVPAAEKKDVPLRNVTATMPGTDKKDEFVVVSAHYDHIGTGRPVDGDAIYNGADDDASGTTAVVLLSEALAKMPPPRRTILFVCFSAEERGLEGSAAFCKRPPVPREGIVANLNLEMLGRPEPGKEGKAWITGSGYSDFADIAGAALKRGGVELIDFRMADQLFAASDNWSFVRHGIVAHSLSAGSLHSDYHRPSDEVERLDIPHMTKVIRALVEVVREFANRDARPEWNDKGKARIARGKR